MAQQIPERNPFMLLMHPEVVLAAVEKSEHLGALNRHLCRPLDRQGTQPGKPGGLGADMADAADDDIDGGESEA